MSSNTLAALVLATGLWIGLAAWAMGGGSTRPNGEFWTSTSSAKVASHPTLVGRSLSQDRKRHAENESKPGHGDRGDRKR